jgi:hypothetical protein
MASALDLAISLRVSYTNDDYFLRARFALTVQYEYNNGANLIRSRSLFL